jgi:guanylate kinase
MQPKEKNKEYLCSIDNKSHRAIIFSGPSGAGKTTIAHHLLKSNASIRFSVSACTRSRRPNEIHGKDYYFLSVHEFKRKIEQDAFIEWEEVYAGSYYGTLRTEVADIWAAKRIAVFDIDVRGSLKLKSYFKGNALAVYVKVPSPQLLTERLRKRKTESQAGIALRMDKVADESNLAVQFDAILINDHLPTSLAAAQALLDKFLAS